MTKKQLLYIIKICPQSVDCGKHCVKPSLMKAKMLGLPQNITQTFIDYGKSWRRWCWLGDLIIREETLPYHYRDEEWEESLDEEREEEWKELRKIEKVLEQQLDTINWDTYENNLDKEEVFL